MLRGKNGPTQTTNKRSNGDGDYQIWVDVLSKDKSNIEEFDLFGTKAAIVWNDGDDEVTIICITSFRNKEPQTNKWDYYSFNIREEYWAGMQPRGSPARIREELKKLGLI